MPMTVARLHQILGDLIAAGHGQRPVCINKTTFRPPGGQEGSVILDVGSASGPEWVPTRDDSDCNPWHQDSNEAGRRVVVLRGLHE